MSELSRKIKEKNSEINKKREILREEYSSVRQDISAVKLLSVGALASFSLGRFFVGKWDKKKILSKAVVITSKIKQIKHLYKKKKHFPRVFSKMSKFVTHKFKRRK